MTEILDFFQEFGYRRDMELRLREVSANEDSLAIQSANQIKHLKTALKELVAIVKIHQATTGDNFAWAELECAEEALKVCK